MEIVHNSLVMPNPKILKSVGNTPYFQDKKFVLYHGDSIELMGKLPEDSIDMIFADPPYNLSNGGFTVHAGRMVSVHKGDWDVSKGFNSDYDFHYKWMEACKRILKPGGINPRTGERRPITRAFYAKTCLVQKIFEMAK